MYLANCTRPDIAFSVNLLARYSSAPTLRHWKGVKHLLRYLRGTSDMGLFYSKVPKPELLGYTDAGYLSDPHKARSQSGYVFTCGNIVISWRSVKQTMVATSSNHSKLLAIHEASRECMWLRSMIQHIRDSSGLPRISNTTTTLYEDNVACIAQLKGGTSKETEQSIFLQSSFTRMSFKTMVRLIYNKSGLVIILQIYSLRHYLLRPSRNFYANLE